MATDAHQRQAQLGYLGDRADGARGDDIPCLALVGLIGEVLRTLGKDERF